MNERSGEAGGVNLYAMVRNNPINDIDEYGLIGVGLTDGMGRVVYPPYRPTQPGDKFATADDAASAAIAHYYPLSEVDDLPASKTKDREYSGFIIKKPGSKGGNDYYTYTKAVPGTPASAPGGVGPLNAVGHYHTHPKVEGYVQEYFSPADVSLYLAQSYYRITTFKIGQPGYVSTNSWRGYVGTPTGTRRWTSSEFLNSPPITKGPYTGLYQGPLIR